MEAKKGKHRYLKVAIIALIGGGAIIGAIFGAVYDRDRIAFDIQKLRTSIGMANALHFTVAFDEGLIVMKRRGVRASREVELPTLKGAVFEAKTVQVTFKSWFFRETITFDKTPALQSP